MEQPREVERTNPGSDKLSCSFCGKPQKEVKKLIAGPEVYICNECIGLCNDIMGEEVVEETYAGSTGVKRDIDEQEWALRVQLAAAYRILDHLGWIDLIYNHLTVRIPGPDKHFLINPYGLMYCEVTASNLVKIDLEGNKITPSKYPVNPAGFVIHSAIHEAVEDAHCIMHTHTTTGMAVACKKDGLSITNFYSTLLANQVGYHDYVGITTSPDEKPRLIKSLGDKKLLILRNHGLLAVGRTIPEAFLRLWTLQRACEVQVLAESMPGDTIPISREAILQSVKAMRQFADDSHVGEHEFAALQRQMDNKDPSYRN